MDSAATEEQRLLVDASVRFIHQVCPLTKVRENAYREPQFAVSYHRRAGDLGWYAPLVPDRLGGGSVSGRAVADAALIAYVRGRRLQPGPFVATNVAAYALARSGSEEQQAELLPSLISGESPAAWVAPSLTDPGGRRATVQASADGAGWVLSGQAPMVQDADSAVWLLVSAESADGEMIQAMLSPEEPGVTVTPLESLDITRRFCEVTFDRVRLDPQSALGSGDTRDLIDDELAVAGVLTAAETVGAMDADFEMALQYAKDRIAFGRPIGSFQAVKHLLADTSLLLEMAKAITLGAAENLDSDDGYGRESTSMAKAFVGDCGIDLAQNCHQVFGGISFTWEHDQHLYLRRITTDAALYGDPDWHRERLCQLAGL